MQKTVLYFFILLFMGCQGHKKEPLPEPFSNYMDYGEYEVGFKTLFTNDVSRPSVPFSDWSGKLYPRTDTVPGRKLPLHIWYPSNEKAPLLPFSHFVDLITPQTESDKGMYSDSLSREIYKYQADELKGEKAMTHRDLDTLLHLTTNSSLETKIAKGPFPLVIVPNGSSPANQSVLCEYLASHGYIVAGVSLKGEFAHVVDASARGLESGVDDLQFALGQLLQLPYVNTGQIALVGNAIESSYCAALASRNKKIKALVSLEGGFLSQYEQRILNETVFYEPHSVSLPILAIYAPHPNISPDNIHGLDFSNRYFARLPEMSEFHFLNYGHFDAYVPKIIGEPRGDLEAGFTAGAELILAFLDAELKNKDESFQQYYGKTPSNKLGKSIDTLFILKGHSPPPNMSALKNLFVTKGFGAIDSIYKSHVAAGNTKPFSQTFYNDYKNWLAYKKDPDYKNRMRLYEMAVESYPNSALNHYRLAYYLEQNKKPTKAREYYQKADILIPLDTSLSPSLKLDLQQALDEVLK
ncbi:acyl-CoA thioester hydrolase/BAAT C-terminal domain-containing protein [Flagellimonas algicola]|uniref:BAAT/Acyl-CoA thioester hydrolase C-terminal domain-containing protein n=1 Tax=Flagellimonas algicola TaxID=2583815 RepID=A0ABY2WJL2_9FLAO|nr:acyl-CoA thioester hydrolase/BAAT C-terminal domain-containing protein [Allomuricauda algicola]TMU54840.1 hypothetical protein FGG15_11625 [Allomuricauda algicola]